MKTVLTRSEMIVYRQCLRAYQRSSGTATRYPVVYLTKIDGERLTLHDEAGPVAAYRFIREAYGIRIQRVPLSIEFEPSF